MLQANTVEKQLLDNCQSSDYHLNQFTIVINDQCKDLGVITSSDLNWRNHYNHNYYVQSL